MAPPRPPLYPDEKRCAVAWARWYIGNNDKGIDTQEKMAKAIGISGARLSQLFTDPTGLGATALLGIWRATGVPFEVLVSQVPTRSRSKEYLTAEPQPISSLSRKRGGSSS